MKKISSDTNCYKKDNLVAMNPCSGNPEQEIDRDLSIYEMRVELSEKEELLNAQMPWIAGEVVASNMFNDHPNYATRAAICKGCC